MSFMEKNEFNIEAGVEYGFMSTTLDRRVAEKYSKGKSNEPSMIFQMRQGMVNRGAFLGFLSEYPHECEILIPPLTGLEVLNNAARFPWYVSREAQVFACTAGCRDGRLGCFAVSKEKAKENLRLSEKCEAG